MVNRITDTPIEVDVYNSRSLISHRFNNKNCVRRENGYLYAVIGESQSILHIFESQDNGFSWTRLREDGANENLPYPSTFNSHGCFAYIVISERFNRFDVIHGGYNVVGPVSSIERNRYELDDIAGCTPADTTIESDMFQSSFDVSYNLKDTFITYVNTGVNKISVVRASPRTPAVSSPVELATTPVFTLHGTCVTEDSQLHMIFLHQDTNNLVKHVIYDISAGWGTPVEIVDLGDTDTEAHSIAIAQDGYGTLCAVWSRLDVNTDTVDSIDYAISKDDGANWTVVQLTPTSGHSGYTDPPKAEPDCRTRVVAGQDGGFMMMYVEDDASSVPKTYLRQITTTDGVTYTLGEEKEIGTGQVPTGTAIAGANFFIPPDIKLMDFRDPGLVRIAYQVGEGSSNVMDDEGSVDLRQELLYASAFPTSLSTETGSHTVDTPDASSIIANLYITGPQDNIDFYAADCTGDYTDRYLYAFDTHGTHMRLLRYEPDSDNLMSDRSAYDEPTEYASNAFFDTLTYGFPRADVSASDQTAWVEQDIRKIYLPPDFHLARTFVVNTGGFLKRTVWTCEYDGNEYEISQVVPRFLANQICYYEANAYVVGPSRDPFSRSVLPSET